MINKENLKDRTGGKTKTSTISQWSHIRWTADDNTHPVSGDEMFDRPSGIFNHGHQDNETMINKQNLKDRTGGKTETKTKQEWAKDTFNPEMDCDSFHRDYVSVIISFDPPVHTTEHGMEVNS